MATVTSSVSMNRRHRNPYSGPLGYFLIAPAVVMVIALFVIPLGRAVYMSLYKWPLWGKPKFVGIGNFSKAFQDPLLVQSLKFTVLYTIVTTVAIFVLAFAMAELVRRSTWVTAFARTAIFMPTAIGLASATLLFSWLYQPEYGILGTLIGKMSGQGIFDYRDSATTALIAVVLMILWKYTGFNMLILLVGIQSIPDELYEAAKVDGASWWHQMTRITLPMLRKTIALLLVLSVTGSFLAFDQFFILTKGGPDNSTITLVYNVYRAGFVKQDLGLASAFALILLVGLVAFNLLQTVVLRGKDDA